LIGVAFDLLAGRIFVLAYYSNFTNVLSLVPVPSLATLKEASMKKIIGDDLHVREFSHLLRSLPSPSPSLPSFSPPN
jgi:hypothetical protein